MEPEFAEPLVSENEKGAASASNSFAILVAK
jgi:hypothetical protein